MSNSRLAPFIGIALIAFSTLLLEVDLTRVFAVTLWYYFGFVSISLALLGIGAAGILCYVKREYWTGNEYLNHMGRFSIELAILCPIVMWIHLVSDFSGYTVSHIQFFTVLALNLVSFFALFFCAGMVIAIGIFKFRDVIGKFYFYDLAGASLGSIAVIILLYNFSAPALAFIVSAAAFLAALLFLSPRIKTGWRLGLITLFLCATLLAILNDELGLLKVRTVKSYDPHSVQTTEQKKVFERWSPVSRVAVFEPHIDTYGHERMRVTNDAGAPTSLHYFDGDWDSLDWIFDAPSNTGLHLRPNGDSLIIGPGGGMDVLSALGFGNKSITAVEINPVIVDLTTKHYSDYIGRIFQDSRVDLHMQEGRNFAAGSKDKYDLITITMIDSWAGAAAGAYMFSENTLYTYEAISDYYNRLSQDGILSISRYYPWDEAIRIVNTYLSYLSDIGVSDPKSHITVVIEPPRRFRRATILLRKGAFTRSEVELVSEVASDSGFTILYAPHEIPEKLLETGEKSEFFREIIQASAERRSTMIEDYPREISPATDDKPFFFFMDRFQDLFNPDLNEHPARRLAMPILYFLFVFFCILAALTIFVPLWLRSDSKEFASQLPMRNLLYFAGIGVGFMLIEISLIHRLTVFLGHPTYSFVVVLSTILLASGLGSLLSERIHVSRLPLVLGAVVFLGAVYALIYHQFSNLMWLTFSQRVLLSILLLAPLGLFLGMCFPLGIRWIRGLSDKLISWAWAINCVFSVFATAASLVVAINFGLTVMLLTGTACYMLNIFLILRDSAFSGSSRVTM